MKLVEEYKSAKRNHSEYFKKYSPSERIKYSKEIIKLKTEIDKIESKIISGILRFTFEYNRVFNELSKNELHHFLRDNPEINRFITNQKITAGAGYNENKRSQILSEFRDLCHKAWKDLIITNDERRDLNEFCRENQIDKTQQYIIEQEISRKYTDGIDLDKVIKDYYIRENQNEESIQQILKREYKKYIELERIKGVISELDSDIISEIDWIEEDKSKLVKTINYLDIITIYLIVINGSIASGFEFEIGFEPGTKKGLKVMISKKTYDSSDKSRLIDLLTDALCYNLCTSDMSLTKFLEIKVHVRQQINRVY